MSHKSTGLTNVQRNAIISKSLNSAVGRAQLAQSMIAPLVRPPMFQPIILAECPVCGSFDIEEALTFQCNKCGLKGPKGESASDGLRLWNKAGRFYGFLVVETELAL